MVQEEFFGTLSDGRTVKKYRITNSFQEYVELLDFGATIHSICVLDANGAIGDVVLGTNDLSAFDYAFVGSTIGRCANRIAFGRFRIGEKEYRLKGNPKKHALHSGDGNYAKKLFSATVVEKNNQVIFSLLDEDEIGFGCTVAVQITFMFGDDHALTITYDMLPDGDTILCPTNHSYFNLSDYQDIRKDTLWIAADTFAVKSEEGIPTGESLPVADTPFDFRKAIAIGDALQGITKFDDTFLLNTNHTFSLVAEMCSQQTKRRMQVYTDMPAIVLFTPVSRGHFIGKAGEPYIGYCAVCLETQFVPNAVNCPQYDSPVFGKRERLVSRTRYQFSCY